MGIKEDMPLLARHEGVWDGTYTYFNAQDEKIDQHKSRLLCRIPESGDIPYHQTNHYLWEDGKTDIREFPAAYHDKRIWWDNELIKGWAAEVPLDEYNRTMMLYWQRQGDPSLYLYEQIQISDDGQSRCRTWHWIRNGQLETRTAIQESFVTKDWRSVDAEMEAVSA
ncbi:MAG: DUF3598 domain-containing protein [Parasphingorhabdus sp.]|uniref:DUF3598 domain-containing protein n=1 Tax=Parasphingorhabdus sp. TaxID=2709688 RepID=UPI003297888A